MPSVSVAVAVLTIEPLKDAARLSVLEARGESGWALPRTTVRRREGLQAAVLRALRDSAGVDGVRPRQIFVLDDPAADSVLVAHVDPITHALLRSALRRPDVRLRDAAAPGRLAPTDLEVVRLAVAALRAEYGTAPDPAGLLPHEFTVRELLAVHEAVGGEPLARDTFRRVMAGRLKSAGRLSTGSIGRPAELYRRTR